MISQNPRRRNQMVKTQKTGRCGNNGLYGTNERDPNLIDPENFTMDSTVQMNEILIVLFFFYIISIQNMIFVLVRHPSATPVEQNSNWCVADRIYRCKPRLPTAIGNSRTYKIHPTVNSLSNFWIS